jgi:hypothetical protein
MTAPVTADDLPLARMHLEQMNIVGLTERFDDTAQLIGAAIGQRIRTTARLNVMQDAPSANQDSHPLGEIDRLSRDPATQRKLAQILTEINEYDLELYASATQRFAADFAQWQAHPPQIESSIRTRTIDAVWSVYESGRKTRNRLSSPVRGRKPQRD